MTDRHESRSEADDEAILAEFFAPLKGLQLPLEAQVRNRAVVADEVQKLLAANRKRRLRWWRRWVSLPAPVAASVLALASWGAFSISRAAIDWPVHGAQADLAGGAPGAAKAPQFYQTETYLCGIGRLNSESGYLLRSHSDGR